MLQLLYTLRVPGRNLYALSWEGTGLRVAMAVGPHIYFANIRRDYKWGYFCDTVVYSFKKPDRVSHRAIADESVTPLFPPQAEDCIIFWNTSTGERNAKSVRHLIAISSCRDLCLLAARVDDTTTQVCCHTPKHVCACMCACVHIDSPVCAVHSAAV